MTAAARIHAALQLIEEKANDTEGTIQGDHAYLVPEVQRLTAALDQAMAGLKWHAKRSEDTGDLYALDCSENFIEAIARTLEEK